MARAECAIEEALDDGRLAGAAGAQDDDFKAALGDQRVVLFVLALGRAVLASQQRAGAAGLGTSAPLLLLVLVGRGRLALGVAALGGGRLVLAADRERHPGPTAQGQPAGARR